MLSRPIVVIWSVTPHIFIFLFILNAGKGLDFVFETMDYLREVSGIWPPQSHRGCKRHLLPPPPSHRLAAIGGFAFGDVYPTRYKLKLKYFWWWANNFIFVDNLNEELCSSYRESRSGGTQTVGRHIPLIWK